MKKLLIYGFVFILLFSFVLAEPPFSEGQTSLSVNSIDIVYPKIQYFEQNEQIIFHFHVHNSTDFLLDNTTTKCLFHVYNSQGSHIIQDNLSFGSNKIDYFYILNQTYTQNLGTYEYIVYCNNSKEAGFISEGFEITIDGLQNTIESDRIALNISIFSIISLFIALCLYIGFGFARLSDNDDINIGINYVFRMFAYLLIWVVFGLMQKATEATVYTELLTNVYIIVGYITLGLIMTETIIRLWSFIPWLIKEGFRYVGNK